MKSIYSNLALGFLLSASLFTNSSVANATIINFDDLGPSCCNAVPNGYNGFNFNNFYSIEDTYHPGSGYDLGTISAHNTMFNGFGSTASFGLANTANSFTLNSFYATAAWNNGLTLFLEGIDNGLVVFSTSLSLSKTIASLVTLNWGGIDTFRMYTNQGGSQVAFDNVAVNVSSVPVPAALPLLATGIIGLGAAARRRNKRKAV
jgi:hypothetical protein